MRIRDLRTLTWAERVVELARWVNPVGSGPSAPLETVAYLDSYGTSLMPRNSRLQGAASGLSVLGARAATGVVEMGMRRVAPPGAGLGRRLTGRALVGGVAGVVGAVPVDDDAPTWRHTLKAVGLVLRAAAIGGAVYDVLEEYVDRHPAKGVVRPIGVSALVFAGTAFWAKQRLERREEEIARWPIPQPNTVAEALPVSWVVIGVGMGVARSAAFTRRLLIDYLGDGITKNVLARTMNAGLWTAAGITLYNAGVGYIGRANEKVDPGYAMPPTLDLVSGSPHSFVTYEDLGQQGRRYVTDVVTPELIEEVMGEPAKAHPIRTFIGFNTEPLYQTGRAELALAELERTKAFDRSYLLLVSPTGTGWVDQTLIESAELLARGDIATCCIQYGKFPSFLSLQKVALGRRQFQLLLWGVKQRLEERPPERRPKVLVFGESLGAWTASDTVMFSGIKGFDHYGIHRALWVGLPWLAKWSRSGMSRGANELVPEGSVRVFDNPEQLRTLTPDEIGALRAVILSHDNDPIAVLGPDLAVKPPSWLGEVRGRGVPQSMQWSPFITFIHTAIDAANAMVTVPGEFGSFGHDYRADMATFVRYGFDLPETTEQQMTAIEATLRRLELERGERIKAATLETAPTAPSHQTEEHRIAAGIPLQAKRTHGSVLARLVGKKGPPQGDIQ